VEPGHSTQDVWPEGLNVPAGHAWQMLSFKTVPATQAGHSDACTTPAYLIISFDRISFHQ
jgi:hypothetical protein